MSSSAAGSELESADRPGGEFAQAVYDVVARIPKGRVMTYGQIAALCGSPRSARIVGQVAHWGPQELPWQRVVNKQGGLARGYTTGGREAHRRDLEAEGVAVSDEYTVDVEALLWWPPEEGSNLYTGQTHRQVAPLVAIVGPTASGKSALAMSLAQRHRGEIIAADSRTIYTGMNIGTAKPSTADRLAVPHHLLDVVDPGQPFSAAQFQRLANKVIDDIHGRGNLPIMVGGTGLYVDSILYNYSFKEGEAARPNPELAALTLADLQARAKQLGIDLNHSDRHNRRRLIRATETNGQQPAKNPLRANTLVLGLSIDQAELDARIAARVHHMVEQGFQQEVEGLLQHHRPDSEAMTGIGYRSFAQVTAGQLSVERAIQQTITDTRRYAKRQLTWFKRNPDIHWVGSIDQAEQKLSQFLTQAV